MNELKSTELRPLQCKPCAVLIICHKAKYFYLEGAFSQTSKSLCGQTVRGVIISKVLTHISQVAFATGLLSTMYSPKVEILLLYTKPIKK